MNRPGASSSFIDFGRSTKNNIPPDFKVYNQVRKDTSVRTSSSLFNLRDGSDAILGGLSPRQVVEMWKKEKRDIDDVTDCMRGLNANMTTGDAPSEKMSMDTGAGAATPMVGTMGMQEPMDVRPFSGHGYFLRSKGCVSCAAFRKHSRCFDSGTGNTNNNSLVKPLDTSRLNRVNMPTMSYGQAKSRVIRRKKGHVKKKKRVAKSQQAALKNTDKNECKLNEKSQKKDKEENRPYRKKIKSIDKNKSDKPTEQKLVDVSYTPNVVPLARRYPVESPLLVQLLKFRTATDARALGLGCCRGYCCGRWRFPSIYAVCMDF